MWPRIVGVGGNNASLFPLQVVYGEDVKVVLRGIEGIEGQSRVESVAHGRVIMAEAAPPHAVVSLAWLCDFVAIHCLCIRNCLAFHNLGFRQPYSRVRMQLLVLVYQPRCLSPSQPRHLLDVDRRPFHPRRSRVSPASRHVSLAAFHLHLLHRSRLLTFFRWHRGEAFRTTADSHCSDTLPPNPTLARSPVWLHV